MCGQLVIRKPAEILQRHYFAFLTCQRVQSLLQRNSRFVNQPSLRCHVQSLVKAYCRATFCDQLVTAVSQQNVEPLVKRPRRVKRTDCFESVNKSFLNRVLSVITIEQNRERMSDRTFLVTLDHMAK